VDYHPFRREIVMKKSLIALALVAGCGASGQSQSGGNAAQIGSADATLAGDAAAADGLTGLYQSGGGTRPSQMCILDRKGKAQFGITLWGPNLRACSGAGTVTRSGDRLKLAMAGDSPCTLDATLQGGAVTFSADVPAGCAYYCGAGTSFAGTTLTRQGATKADALKAKDMAGEALCG
jgi:hypothetical protein